MNKRRVTLNLDVDVVEALQAVGGSSMSAIANDALREALESRAHQAELLRWLDELDAKHGAPTEAELAEADAFLDALERGDVGAGQRHRENRAPRAELARQEGGDPRHRAAVLHQLAEQRAQQERGKYCATNWAPLPMKVCVRLGEQRLTGEAAASRAADGASSSTLQPP